MRCLGSSATPFCSSVLMHHVRMCTSKPKPDGAEQQHQQKTSEGGKGEGAKAKKEESAEAEEGADPAAGGNWISREWRAWKKDWVAFPDIYNSANLINFIVFTVFCLCSTGSAQEYEWWKAYWGIDAAVSPTGWLLHSFLMDNFLSMAFAMIMLYTMCHNVLPLMGSKPLLAYLMSVSAISGVCMWGFNFAMGNKSEKQYGPWDMVSALFVLQYVLLGFTPLTILGSFNGWVKYANFVGAACILFYDIQPVVCGTILGVLLSRTKLVSKLPAAAAAGAKP